MATGIDHALSEWPYPRLVAHRCGGTLAPENTLAGFDACRRYGYRMVEFDAKLSADEQLFLLHDDTLDRTTNGRGDAAKHTWTQLAALDAGSWLDRRFAGERLHDGAADVVPNHSHALQIEFVHERQHVGSMIFGAKWTCRLVSVAKAAKIRSN